MKEGITAPVGRKPSVQILPALYLVNRLIRDQPLQDRRRGLPVDSLEDKEAAVEPRAKQMHEIGINRGPFRMLRQRLQQVSAQANEKLCSSGSGVQSPEERSEEH